MWLTQLVRNHHAQQSIVNVQLNNMTKISRDNKIGLLLILLLHHHHHHLLLVLHHLDFLKDHNHHLLFLFLLLFHLLLEYHLQNLLYLLQKSRSI